MKTVDENQCAQCGTVTPPGAKYCESCGTVLAVKPVQPVPAIAPVSGYQAPRAYVPYTTTPYQGVAIRFVAILIDTIIIAIIAGILSAPFNAFSAITNNASGTVTFSFGSILGGLVSLGYSFCTLRCSKGIT